MLAIIIPYYKLTFFEFTIKSLASQTDQRFKVYIGDDNSLEKPIEILNKYKDQFDFEYTYFNKNLGGISLTKQWERSINLSQDEKWIMILGDDDVLGDNVVEEFYKNLDQVENEKISVIRFSTCNIDEKNEVTSQIYIHPKIENVIDFLFREKRSSLSEYVFKKDQVLEIGFKNFPLGWFSDLLAVLEFSEFGNIFTINTAILKIRVSDYSISGSQSNLKLKSRATLEFYYYLIKNKSNHFSAEQNQILTSILSKCFYNDKKNIIFFLKISWLFWKRALLKEFLKGIFSNYFKGNARRL